MKILRTTFISSSAFALPMLALAQTTFQAGYVTSIITAIQTWVELLIPVLIALAMVAFFYGLVKYIWSGADDAKVKGKNMMIWGVIAIAVMVSLWGLVGLLQSVTNVGSGAGVDIIPNIPQ